MKKIFFACLAGVLSVALLVSTAFAYSKTAVISSWAQEEVARAETLEIFSSDVMEDYTAPISRENFCSIALNYVAIQNNCSPILFQNLMERFELEKDETGKIVNPFIDGDSVPDGSTSVMAHKLNIVMGDEKGAFNYGKTISRQEAAAMLIRAYQACGGELPKEAAEITFTDGDKIPEWAEDGASALSVWGVMKGDEKGNFMPDKPCTWEHAILMFLRLYENAPVSRSNGNVKGMFSYEQCMELLEDRDPDIYRISQKVEGNGVTFLREEFKGMRLPITYLYFVYRAGGIRFFLLPVEPEVAITDAAFSEDGKTFTCTLSTATDVVDLVQGVTLKAGTYRATVDTQTLQNETVQIGPAPMQ